jgi:hypothetical protein
VKICRIQEKYRLKNKVATIILLMLLSVSFLLLPLSVVRGQAGVNIYLLSPQDTGVVGQEASLQGTIDTLNGAYEVWFGSNLVVSKKAEGSNVNANFTIPRVAGGEYTITLRDVKENVNATSPFNVVIAYYLEALAPSAPALLQEGGSIVLNVTLTGVNLGTAYYANVTVELPSPVNTNYSQVVALDVSSQTAVATAQVTYPASAFQPAGSLTAYTGSYKVYLNRTQSLAEDQFFVGFTDLSEYHRDQTVKVHAIGYQPNENALINITYAETGASEHSETVTASSEGVINSAWAVPFNALVGDYNITITPENTAKAVPDAQLFTVPGYSVKIRNLNLAGEIVPQIVVEALDQATETVYNGTSGDDGIATLNLERGDHTVTAFWNDVQVGEINVTITGANSFDLTCELTNIKITVQNKKGDLIPFVTLDITYQYITTKEHLSRTGHISGQADPSAIFIMSSVLPRISYSINASLYGVVFNLGNNTVTNLPAQAIYEVTVLCPSQTLTLSILDFNGAAIPNARIELVELTSGVFGGAVTDAAGKVTMEVTFGKYRLRVYTNNNILLNTTIIEVFSDTQSQIRCSLYNIRISVKVVDYFGQSIPNVSVTLYRSGTDTRSATTQADGTTTFSNVIGGNVQIIAYPQGLESSFEALNLQIEEPTTIQMKLAKYILIGPFLVEASVLATFIIVLLAVILFASIEFYRRKRARSASSES